ncbi:hypothetical protein [Methanocaldococcus sp.]
MFDIIIEQINAKEVFKGGELKLKVSVITNLSVGYDIVKVDDTKEKIAEIENVIAPEIVGYSVKDLEFVDSILSELNLDPLSTMPVSISLARSLSNALDFPLFKLIGGFLISELPTVASNILTDKTNYLFPIIMAESIDEIIEVYLILKSKLDNKYILSNECYLCNNIFDEVSYIREMIDEIKEDEDIDILLGLSGKKEILKKKDLSLIDYLETEEPIEFDGFLCTENLCEESDFIKVNPYELSTISELSYYINYINEKDLTPVIFGDNTSLAHIATGFKIPLIRTSLTSNILNEVWNIERELYNPNISRF